MIHLSPDLLRRYCDEPDALLTTEKEHLLACASCRKQQAQIADNAAFASAALALPARRLDLAAARRAVETRQAVSPAMRSRGVAGWSRGWFVAAAAVLVVACSFAFAPVRATASNFLAIFEPHTFVPIGVTGSDLASLRGLPDLGEFGKSYDGNEPARSAGFDNIVAAERWVNGTIAVPRYVPVQFGGDAQYSVMAKHSAAFTFEAAKARAFAARNHATLPAMPPGLDGSTLYATIGPVVTSVYGRPGAAGFHSGSPQRPYVRSQRQGFSGRFSSGPRHGFGDILTIVQAPAPRVYSTGASVNDIVGYLLAQPGISPSLVAQIRAIGDLTTSLPIPVFVDKMQAQRVAVQGVSGLALGDETGLGSVVIWERNGMVFGVFGTLRESEVLAVANSLTL